MEFSQIVVKRFMSKRQFFSSRWSSPGYRRLQSVGTYGNKRVSQCPKNLRNWQKFEFQLIQCDKYIQHMFHACWKDEYFLDLKTCYNMKQNHVCWKAHLVWCFLLLASCAILPTWLNLFLQLNTWNPQEVGFASTIWVLQTSWHRSYGERGATKKQMIPRPQTRQHLDKL